MSQPLLSDGPQKIVDISTSWLHVVEIGKNEKFNDEEYQKKLKAVGWKPGLPWCMFDAKMVWLEAYKDTSVYEEIDDVLKGGVVVSYRNAKASPIIKVQQKPVVGGIVCWSTGNGRGHAGIITHIVDDFTVKTIEGNTSRAGVRDGDKRMAKHRKLQPTAKHNGDWHYLGTIVPPDYAYLT